MQTHDFFERHHIKENKEHFIHLVQVALADGVVEQSELNLLHHFGHKMGFTEPEIDALIKSSAESAFNPPYELEKRFDQLYRIVKMVFANGNVDENDMDLVNNIALKSGFQPQEISVLIPYLIVGIKKGLDDEDLFEEYLKKKRIAL
jgi:hypothetical protein